MEARKNKLNTVWENISAIFLSLLIHALIAVFFIFGVDWFNQEPIKRSPAIAMIKAELVDIKPMLEKREKEQQAQTKKQKEQQLQERRKKEQAKQAALKKKQEQEVKKKQQELARKKAQKEAEHKKKLKKEREKQLAAIKKQREAAEKERQLAQQKLAQLEAKRKQEEQDKLKQMEAERQRQLLAYETNSQKNAAKASLAAEYKNTIEQIVTQNWRKPVITKSGLNCAVRIYQIPGGEVVNAEIIAPCNAEDIVRRSIIDAVYKSQPLPYQGYEAVFDRQIQFNFKYNG